MPRKQPPDPFPVLSMVRSLIAAEQAAGRSLTEIAAAWGLQRQNLNRILHLDEFEPSAAVLRRILLAVGCKLVLVKVED